MRTCLICLALIIISWDARAQLKTYISLEAGPHWSMIKANDPLMVFGDATVRTSIAGVLVEQEIMEDLALVTGLYYRPYKLGINMEDNRRFQNRNDYYNSLMIPLRIQYRIEPTDYPVMFLPRLGYIFSTNSMAGEPANRSSILSSPDGTAYAYNQTANEAGSTSHLLEVGMGVAIRLPGSWKASLNIYYQSGVLNKNMDAIILEYDDLQDASGEARYNTHGNGLSTTLSLHAPLSHIWQNKQYRIRSRIEGSAFDGKNVDRKGQLYLGGEVGSLWRIFLADNPAIGPRPMDGRGLFRHANLHTGAYAGYMFADNLGVDLGIYYQRSSSFYAVMYDHDVDFTGRTSAPLYLEVPVRLRYFYPIIENDLYAVVAGGISLLTHFSGGSVTGPGGDFTYTEASTQAPASGTVTSVSTRISRFSPVLRLGIGAEYKLPIDFPLFLSLYLNHMKGFLKTGQLDVTTSLPEVPGSSTIDYYGSGWSLDLGVKVPMSFDDRQDCVRLTRKKK